MTELGWFPYDVDAWETRVREQRLSFEQEGILLRLYRGAWRAAQPCTIPDDEDEFARILGAHWAKALPLLRTEFTPIDGSPALLRSAWLWAMYERQLEKHLSYQRRGGLGGRPRKLSNSSAESSAIDNKAQVTNAKAEVTERVSSASAKSKAEGNSSAPPSSGHRAIPPAGSALAPVGAAPRAPATRTPVVAVVPDTQRVALERQYTETMLRRADEWLKAHPDKRAEIEAVERKSIGLPPTGSLGPASANALRVCIAEAVRLLHPKWPDRDTWVSSELAKASAGTPQSEAFATSG